jgi:glycosyltransferase involved in cell wall biosynthesis
MTSIPRICMLIDRYLPVVGGAETQAYALSEELAGRGYEIQILTRRIKSEFPVKEVIGSNQVYRLSPVGLSHKANVFVMFTAIWHLIRHRRTFEVLHVHGIGPLGIASIIASKLLRKKVILKIASYGDLRRRDAVGIAPSLFSRVVRRILLPPRIWFWFLGQANCIVTISREIEEEANSLNLAKNTYIPNGVDTKKYVPASVNEKTSIKHELNLPAGHLLVFLGRLVDGKRGDVLIQGIPSVLEKYPETLTVFLGTGRLQQDDVEEELKQQVNNLGLEDNVYFAGEVNNAVSYLQAADVFVFPSEKEGLPNALLEAMACGLPSVVCEIGGVTDIADETTSWVVPVGDVGAFSQAIISALSNPDEAQKRGTEARRKIESQFSLEVVADAYEALYGQLLISKRS